MGRLAPRPAGAALEAVRRSLAPATPLGAVQGAWSSVVGPQVAAAAAPVAERGGAIVVRCRSAVWAQELDLMQEALLASLRERLGEAAPDALRFETGSAGRGGS
jgi:predicted nucleic acid-binding Zn ribbon protein